MAPSRKRIFVIEPERIRALREKMAWTQREAAEIIGLTERAYFSLETGKSPMRPIYWTVLCGRAGVGEDWRPQPAAPDDAELAAEPAPPADPE